MEVYSGQIFLDYKAYEKTKGKNIHGYQLCHCGTPAFYAAYKAYCERHNIFPPMGDDQRIAWEAELWQYICKVYASVYGKRLLPKYDDGTDVPLIYRLNHWCDEETIGNLYALINKINPDKLVRALYGDNPESEKAETTADKKKDAAEKRRKAKKEKELQKHIHGEYRHVRLTDDEYNRLIADYGAMAIEDKIKELDEYLEMRADKHYSSHNAVIRKWLRSEGIVKLSERSADNKAGMADIPSSPSFDIDLIMQHALHSVPTVQVRSDK